MPRRTPRTAPDRQRTPRRFPKFLGAASICALIAALLSPLTQATAADSTTALAANDYCGGQCSDILPPGQNGNATLAQILLNQAFGIQPDHAEDQLGPYNNLASGAATLTDAKINDFFNDASFGVASDQVASTTAPGGRTDVTIVRDKKTGVPHITGTTRYGTEYGAGYAAAQDRLWLMDVFRHVGRGQLTSFAGGAPPTRVWSRSSGATRPTPRPICRPRSTTPSRTTAPAASRPSPTPTPTSTASTPTSTPPTAAATSPVSTS